jgi:NAD(P)-dependent dehydrogenase (short-subunit alcohol dehydrogenase family)
MSKADGSVAWVAGVGDPAGIGRAVALTLAAGGSRVLVTGQRERPLGECVGEIAHAGGVARHHVADAEAGGIGGEAACLEAAAARFDGLDIAVLVIEGRVERAERACSAALAALRGRGRVVVVATGADAGAGAEAFARRHAADGAPRAVTVNVLLAGSAPAAIRRAEPEDVAELVKLLCAPAADVLTGSVLAVS